MAKLDPKTCTLLFPGQGSQIVGMGKELAQSFPSADKIFKQADKLLNHPLSSLAWSGPKEELDDTINTQPALFVHSMACLAVFKEYFPGFRPAFVAGHSMGEISALAACGGLTFEAGLRLARTRGELMKSAGERSPGGMAAILSMEIGDLEQICAQASQVNEIVQVANDNCPGQVVISGSEVALERAMQLAEAEVGARRVRRLAVSIAAHSPLMLSAQKDFNQALEEASIQNPDFPLVGNVNALPLSTAKEIQNDLRAQLTSRVRWTESIQEMTARGVELYIELGSGSVLTGLLKRIDANVKGYSFGEPKDFDMLNEILNQDD